jgi:hypothetical protein
MVTFKGTCAAALLLERLTTAPPLGATLLSVTLPVEPCPAVTVAGFVLTDRNGKELLIEKVAVSVSVTPLDSFTNCVMVCVPSAAVVVFHGFAPHVG